jgi:hypothetical protein
MREGMTTPPRTPLARIYATSPRSAATSSTEARQNAKGAVLFQKILRPPAGQDDLTFLGSLVGLLQDGWALPTDLPMVYDKKLHEHSSSSVASDAEGDRAVLTWNSPLSPDATATALQVHVVAIYPEKTSSSSLLAMVVLSKDPTAPTAFGKLPTLLQSLFADSEQRIVRNLERTLEDAEEEASRRRPSASGQAPPAAQARRDMLAELMEDVEPPMRGAAPGEANPILDAEVVEKEEVVDEPTSTAVPRAPAVSSSSSAKQPSIDFAVQAAQRIAQQQQQEGFAVQAARKLAQQKKKLQEVEIPSTASVPSSPIVDDATPSADSVDALDPRQYRPPNLSKEALASRSFSQSISKPEDYLKKRSQTQASTSTKQQKASPESVIPQDRGAVQTPKEIPKTPTVSEARMSPAPDTMNRQVNIVSEETADPREEERLRLANEALDETVASSDDLSAEEMLNAVMQFGDEQKKEEEVGDGFVSGAFEKAKEILQEQHRKRTERLRQEVTTKVVEDFQGFSPTIRDAREVEPANLTPEEELRQMFEAGEKLADHRISIVDPNGDLSLPTAEDDKIVDDLVAYNKEVSSYARVLDDELVELEMRINKSPDEALDGPRQNAVFDIFSGPEVYNPNVDPETAVNWPGALPDTKNTRLPKELDEAVKQARFAATFLSKLEEREENGVTTYFAGERKLTEGQVSNMRTVVDEASTLGLISDPLEVMADRARLQMLIDEVWHQPAERFRDIVSEYKEVLLSDHFVGLVKDRLQEMADRDLDALRNDDTSQEENHSREREVLGGLVAYAQLLVKETRALGAELEAQQLEVIRSICKVAMDPSLQTEEETTLALTTAVRDMRPLFDDAFIAYLKYAVAEEEARLARAGVLDDPEHAQWLYVLKIVQQGVYNEIGRSINRYIDHVGYIMRMDTAKERRMLLEEIVDALPTLDVRPFVQVVDNIAGALGDSARGEFDGAVPLGEMTNKILQLRRDMNEVLPPERITVMSRDADEWARKRKEKLLKQRKESKQRLKAASETEHLDEEINGVARRGEMERFD